MFSFLRKNLIAELVILVVESEYNEHFSMTSHVFVSTPTKIQLHELKKRISGVTTVPPERIMLIFCGQVLSIEHEYVPLEAFEPAGVVDEDNLSFRPRLCLRIIDDPNIYVVEEEPDAERRRPGGDDDANKTQTNQKQRHKHKGRNYFDLEKELGGEVNCIAFAPSLRKAGYDNEGAFANLSLDVLHGAGLWIPMAAARRIHSACLQVKKRLAQKDREEGKHHYRQLGAELGDAQHPQDDDDAGEPHEMVVVKNKADARREYEAEVIRQKKVAREEAALLKSGKGRKQSEALKQHSEELQLKIDAIRRRCAQEAEQSSGDFDEITGILYNSYNKLRATNQKMNQHLHIEGAWASTAEGVPRASHDTSCAPPSSAALVTGSGGSPTRALRALRTSASSASLTSPSADRSLQGGGSAVARSGVFPDDAMCGYCCANHKQAVLANREKYFARRRLSVSLELKVQLERLRSSHSGYVTSATLRAIAEHHLKQYRGMPRRSADPALVSECVEASRLDLHEQRSTVLWVQSKEVEEENLLSVVPVRWYSPNKFIAHFVELLEELDRERLVEEPE